MTILGWKIFYDDGTTFSSRQGTFAEAPDTNVLTIVGYQMLDEPKTNITIYGRNYYSFDGERFYKTDDTREIPAGLPIKYGKWADNEPDYLTLIQNNMTENWRTARR